MDDFRIPKVSVDIVCHTTDRDTINGQIFLDLMSVTGYSLSQVLDFFNSPAAFFPFRTTDGGSILLHKKRLLRVDLPGLSEESEDEISSLLALKREARVFFANGTMLEGRFIIDMPEDHARSLDLLNAGRAFIPFLLDETLALIHTDHIYKVEES
jgi:hypothetical protein